MEKIIKSSDPCFWWEYLPEDGWYACNSNCTCEAVNREQAYILNEYWSLFGDDDDVRLLLGE